MKLSISQDSASLLFELSRRLADQARHQAPADPSRFLRIKTLYILANQELPTMKDVADCFGITPPSATSMINKLVKAKYIERQADPSDRRTIRLKLTKAGRQKLDESISEVNARIDKLMNVLSAEERRQFTKILKKIINS